MENIRIECEDGFLGNTKIFIGDKEITKDLYIYKIVLQLEVGYAPELTIFTFAHNGVVFKGAGKVKIEETELEE